MYAYILVMINVFLSTPERSDALGARPTEFARSARAQQAFPKGARTCFNQVWRVVQVLLELSNRPLARVVVN